MSTPSAAALAEALNGRGSRTKPERNQDKRRHTNQPKPAQNNATRSTKKAKEQRAEKGGGERAEPTTLGERAEKAAFSRSPGLMFATSAVADPVDFGGVAPGAKLTPAFRRILQVLFDPKYFGRPVPQIARAAGCTAAHVYNARKDPAFQQAVRDILAQAVGPMLPALMDAAFRSALVPGTQGATDRWRLLELGGFGRPEKAGDDDEPKRHAHMHVHRLDSRLGSALAQREQQLKAPLGHTSGTLPAPAGESVEDSDDWGLSVLSE